MLRIIRSISELNVGSLMQVYAESNQNFGCLNYPHESENMRILMAEQDLYNYINLFFQEPSAVYAVWDCSGTYKAALRIEPYNDGFLLNALETAPTARRQGNATNLIRALLKWLPSQKISKLYSHVDKTNRASISVHEMCGFQRILEYAVYLDGSVTQASCTFCYVSEE